MSSGITHANNPKIKRLLRSQKTHKKHIKHERSGAQWLQSRQPAKGRRLNGNSFTFAMLIKQPVK